MLLCAMFQESCYSQETAVVSLNITTRTNANPIKAYHDLIMSLQPQTKLCQVNCKGLWFIIAADGWSFRMMLTNSNNTEKLGATNCAYGTTNPGVSLTILQPIIN